MSSEASSGFYPVTSIPISSALRWQRVGTPSRSQDLPRQLLTALAHLVVVAVNPDLY